VNDISGGEFSFDKTSKFRYPASPSRLWRLGQSYCNDIQPMGNLVKIRFRSSVTPPYQAACGGLVKVIVNRR